MSRAWIANQIIGAMFGITGLYIIGDWRIVLGLLLVMFGDNIQKSVPKHGEGKPDLSDNHWVE